MDESVKLTAGDNPESPVITATEAEAQLTSYASKVSENDVADLAGKSDKIKGYFEHVSALKGFFNDAADIFALFRDRVSGVYTSTPWKTIAGLAGAVLYVVTPLDLLPDVIPLAGFLDDAVVFGLALKFARMDIAEYRAWKKARELSEAQGNSSVSPSSQVVPRQEQP